MRLRIACLAVLGIGAVLCLPRDVRAATLNKSNYGVGEDILITERVSPEPSELGFFDTTTGEYVNGFTLYAFPISVIEYIGESDFSYFVPGKYVAVEFTYDGLPDCDKVSYETCKTLSDFVAESLFTIGGESGSAPSGGARVHTPEIVFPGIASGKPIHGTVLVPYAAKDLDEDRGHPEWGLAQFPVSFFYSPPFSFNWTLVAENLPANGTYHWDTSKLPDGDRYRFQAVVRGEDGDIGQVMIDNVVIDNTPPHFSARMSPPFSRGEPIEIEIESSEALKDPPAVTVTQKGRASAPVSLKGDALGRTFVGTYDVAPGYDGPATLVVGGTDLAGNRGTGLVGATEVVIGTRPPPHPVITSPATSTRSNDPFISRIAGSAPLAARVTARVNGGKERSVAPAADGSFAFENIALDPLFDRGKNVVHVYAVDDGGAASEPAAIEALVNSPPAVAIVDPRGRGHRANGNVRLVWDASDPNRDALAFRIEISPDAGKTWRTIREGLSEEEFLWNSEEVPDGSYLVRVTASDGIAEASAVTDRIGIENNLPAIVLEESGELFTTETSKTFRGAVRNKTDILEKLEFSADDGKTWQDILPSDNAWDGPFEPFSFGAPALLPGEHTVILRGTSRSGRVIVSAERTTVSFDGQNPALVLATPAKEPLTDRNLELRGLAEDEASGIARVEYTVDDKGPFEATLEGSRGGRSMPFAVAYPTPLSDGPHAVALRAFDRAGNASRIVERRFRIDATPPRAGSYTLHAGSVMLFPDSRKTFAVKPEVELGFRLSVAGAPRSVRLFTGDQPVPLAVNATTGLWESVFPAPASGIAPLTVETEDAFHNFATRELGKIKVSEP